MCSPLYIFDTVSASAQGQIPIPNTATSWSTAGPTRSSARQVIAYLNMGMNRPRTTACRNVWRHRGVAECLFASYLKDHKCSLKINEKWLSSTARLLISLSSSVGVCQIPLSLATNGKTLFPLTYNFSLQQILEYWSVSWLVITSLIGN